MGAAFCCAIARRAIACHVIAGWALPIEIPKLEAGFEHAPCSGVGLATSA